MSTVKKGKKRRLSPPVCNEPKQSSQPPSKKRKISKECENTIRALLTMPTEEINQLPQSIKNQAIALRESANIIKNKQNNNKIQSNQQHAQDEKAIESSDSDSDSSSSSSEAKPQPDTRQNAQQSNQANNSAIYRPAQKPFYTQPRKFQNTFAMHTPQRQYQSAQIYTPSTQMPSVFSPSPAISHSSKAISQPLSSPIPRYMNAQDLDVSKQEESYSYSLTTWICGFFLMIFLCILSVPFLSAIPFGHSFKGIKFCDTNSRLIQAFNDYDCVQCPLLAKYCIGGRAWCHDYFVMDYETNKCVKRSYVENVSKNFKQLWNYFEFGKVKEKWDKFYAIRWSELDAIKEWKLWFTNMQNMQFADFCKLYQMEIMIAFFMFSWNMPKFFHCPIVFGWTKMILPLLSAEKDGVTIILLNVLSYFAVYLFGYTVWNKINGFFGSK